MKSAIEIRENPRYWREHCARADTRISFIDVHAIGTSRFRPVISFGCGNPSKTKSVGATSARIPSRTWNFRASLAT